MRIRLIKKRDLSSLEIHEEDTGWDRGWELLFQTSRRRRDSQLRISEVIKSPEMEQNKGGELISRNLYRTCWENSLTCAADGEMRHGSFSFRESDNILLLVFVLPVRFTTYSLLHPYINTPDNSKSRSI